MLDYRETNCKDSILIFLGTSPAQNVTRNTNLDVYRNAMADFVLAKQAQGMTKIYGIDLGKSFDRTIASNYVTTDGTGGDALHPGNIVSQAGIANKLITGSNYDGTLTNFGGKLPDGGLMQLGITV